MSSEIRVEQREQNWVARELVDFQKQLILWCSDSVLREFLNFREALNGFGTAKADGEDMVVALRPVIKAAAALLKAMRKDVGYTFTSFSAKDLAIMQLRDDPESQRLIDSL